MSSNLEAAKIIVKDNYDNAECGIYNTRNTVFDQMVVLYDRSGLRIEMCPTWSYFEVFGLSEEEFQELKEFYRRLQTWKGDDTK